MFRESALTKAQWSVVNAAIAQHGLTVEQEVTVCQLLEYRARDPWEFNEHEAAHKFCTFVKRDNPMAPDYVPFFDTYINYAEPFWGGMPLRKLLFKTGNGFLYMAPTTDSIAGYDFYTVDDFGNCVRVNLHLARVYKQGDLTL